jgi:hypothetical protein
MNQTAPTIAPEQVQMLYTCLQRHAQGRANAKTARWLVANLGMNKATGDRLLRAIANAATENGLLICTGNAGYWLPDSLAEAEETIGRLHSQGVQMLERAKEMRALVDRHFTALRPNAAGETQLTFL